jgi:tetratricopeptide (TPR) repeat protein
MMRLIACALGLMLVAGVARADEAFEKARVHSQAGIAYYDESRYDEAAREIEAAYRLKPLPELKYNLAECYERLGRVLDAARAYRAYLDGKPNAADRALVETRIKNLQEQGDRPTTPPRGKVVLKTIVVYRELPPPPGRAARGAAYGTLVIGVAAFATGIAASVLASQAARDELAAASTTNPTTFDGRGRDAQTRLQTYQIVAGVGFTFAALGGAAFGVLYWLGGKIDREAKKLTLSASVSPYGVGVFAGGSF